MKEYILTEYDTPFTALDNVIGELIRCRECKHRMHNGTCIKVMKRKPDDGFCDEGEVREV